MASLYNPLPNYSTSSYISPFKNIDYKNATPENMARWGAEQSLKNAATTTGGLAADRNEYAGAARQVGNDLYGIYGDMASGGWDLTPEQQANILDLERLDSSFNPAQQMSDWRSDTGNLINSYNMGAGSTRDAAQQYIDALYAGIDPVKGYDDKLNQNLADMWSRGDQIYGTMSDDIRGSVDRIREGLTASGPWTSGGGMALYGGTGAGGGYGSGWSGGAASVGPVDYSGLDLDPEFIQNYKLTPEQKQAWINLAMQGAGGRYRAGLNEAERRLAASGVSNPFGYATMRDRFERLEGQAADDARLAAMVGGEGEEDRRLLDIESLRGNNERTRASLANSAAIANAQLQDSALGRSFSASEAAANRAFQAQMAAAAEAAAMERFYKELGLTGETRAMDALGNLGATGLGWTQYGTNTELQARQDRERDLAERTMNAANLGYGAQLQNEQSLMDRQMGMYGNIAGGTQDVYNNISNTGLNYSNAVSDRYKDVYGTNQANRAAGVAGLGDLYGTNMDARQNTWDQTNAANQVGNAGYGQGVGTLASYKNSKPGFMNSFVAPLASGLAGGIGKAIVGG